MLENNVYFIDQMICLAIKILNNKDKTKFLTFYQKQNM